MMKKKLTNNMSLKIISVLVAFIIWILVSSVNDPVKNNVRYPVKVTVTNEDYIYDSGKTYQISDEDRTVMVYITGKQSVVENRTDIVVEADLTNIVDMEADIAYVPVKLREIKGISMSDVTILPQTIPISIEDSETKDFMITVNTSGTPGNGYAIGEATASPEKITIQGPKSTIGKIKSVVATVDVEGITRDTSSRATIKVIDQNGEEMTEAAMEYLQFFNMQEDRTVDVSVKLWEIVDNIRIKANYSGTPAYGYQVDSITTTPDVISVAVSEDALKTLKENNNTVEIPSEFIDVSGVSKDLEASIKLNAILKEEDGFRIPEAYTQTVQVRVSILPFGSKEVQISTSVIETSGLEKGQRLIFNQDYLTVRVKGTDEDLSELKTENIQASVDVSGLDEGEYTIPVEIILPEGYQQVESTTATVLLMNVESTSE